MRKDNTQINVAFPSPLKRRQADFSGFVCSDGICRVLPSPLKRGEGGERVRVDCRSRAFAQIAALIFAAIFSASFASAGSGGGGTVAVPFLKMDMGARYYGMAGAATAFADDVTGMTFYNPAALGRVQSLQISGSTYKNAIDMKHTYGALAVPVGFLSLAGNKPLSLGISFYMFDKGDISSRSIGDDISFALTYGENIAAHTWDFMGSSSEVNHYLGASVKYIKSTLPLPGSGDVTGNAFAFDAGYQIVADNRFGIGFAVKNVGTKIKYLEEADPLPSTMSAGLFFTLVDYENMRWDLSGDVIYHIKERENRIRAGTEAVFFNTLAVRGGIKFMEEIKEEFTLGFGLRLFGFEVDLGAVLNPQLNGDNVYQAGISYKFPIKKEENNYQKDEKKRSDYKEYKERQVRQAQEQLERNANPILYQ
ncbi:MAG: PorV/PorQ family protein [Elusimicrobiota bacterium]|jgi:hypothetical protein|nr:PorV/PorQ family protein [Elusimicrobiota bacterium]